jgi:SOS response regulatory protein OraA/RecX
MNDKIKSPIVSDTESIEEMIEELKDVLDHLNEKNKQSAEMIDKLHALPVSDKDIAMVLEVLFGE